MRSRLRLQGQGQYRSALAVGVWLILATVEPTLAQVVVPVEREPQHRPALRNTVVAVLDVRFPPGYTSLFHTHANDNVSVRIATGPTRIDTLTLTGDPQTALVGRVVFNSASPPYTHRVANLGDTPIHILDIEILASAPTPLAGTPDELAGHDLIIDNDRVRIHRIVVAPGQTLAAHTHPRGRVVAEVRSAAPGRFVWQAPGQLTAAIAASTGATEIVEIEVK
jgi:quercetin dioxygenase-like cupin family protein